MACRLLYLHVGRDSGDKMVTKLTKETPGGPTAKIVIRYVNRGYDRFHWTVIIRIGAFKRLIGRGADPYEDRALRSAEWKAKALWKEYQHKQSHKKPVVKEIQL